MQPVCVFIIIVLGFIALWLLAFDSDSTDVAGEYYTSGATALDATITLAGGGIAGPIPHNPAKMFGPRRNPAFGAYDRFLKRNASKRENFDSSNPAKTYSIDPGEIVCVRATPPPQQDVAYSSTHNSQPFWGWDNADNADTLARSHRSTTNSPFRHRFFFRKRNC